MVTVYKRGESPYYQAAIEVGGVRRRISTQERNRKKAEAKAIQLEREANEQLRSEGALTLTEAAARFFATKSLRPLTVASYKMNLTNVYGTLGDFVLATLTERDLKQYIQTRLRQVYEQNEERKRIAAENGRPAPKPIKGHVTLRHDLAFLSSLYTAAKHWDDRIVNNPAMTLDKSGLDEAAELTRWLRPKEVQAIYAACTEEYQRLFITLAVFTGMRSGELRNLTWGEVDLSERIIFLGSSDPDKIKNGTARQIPLVEEAYIALRDTKRITQGNPRNLVIFKPHMRKKKNGEEGSPFTTFKTFWKGVQKRSGVKGVRIHDLRHTFASWGKQHDIDDEHLMEMMGHKTRSMVRRYSHVSNESLRKAASRLPRVTLGDTKPTD